MKNINFQTMPAGRIV